MIAAPSELHGAADKKETRSVSSGPWSLEFPWMEKLNMLAEDWTSKQRVPWLTGCRRTGWPLTLGQEQVEIEPWKLYPKSIRVRHRNGRQVC